MKQQLKNSKSFNDSKLSKNQEDYLKICIKKSVKNTISNVFEKNHLRSTLNTYCMIIGS